MTIEVRPREHAGTDHIDVRESYVDRAPSRSSLAQSRGAPLVNGFGCLVRELPRIAYGTHTFDSHDVVSRSVQMKRTCY